MKTTYYFAETNADPIIIAVRGNEGYLLPCEANGNDATTGVNIFDGDVIENLRAGLKKLAGNEELYNMDDIKLNLSNFSENFFVFNENDYETLTELISIE